MKFCKQGRVNSDCLSPGSGIDPVRREGHPILQVKDFISDLIYLYIRNPR